MIISLIYIPEQSHSLTLTISWLIPGLLLVDYDVLGGE